MSINVKCPGCEGQYVLKDTQAGMQVKCPRCGGTIAVPQPVVTSAQPTPPAPQPPVKPPDPQPPVKPPAAAAPAQGPAPPGQVDLPATAKILSNLKMAGIFNIVVGILSLLWAIMMLLGPIVERGDPKMRHPFVILLSLGLFALSVACGIIELVAGIKLLKRAPGARKLGLISGFVSCASLWGCCVYPFCLAAGIFTLILLFKEHYRVFLERGEAVG